MPHQVVIEHALNAHEYVKNERETEVSFKHMLPSLLRDSEVSLVIRELDKDNKISEKEDDDDFLSMFGSTGRGRNSRNFIKFQSAVREAISPSTDGEEKFYHRPGINPELKSFLLTMMDPRIRTLC
jgi:hypothetical protein